MWPSLEAHTNQLDPSLFNDRTEHKKRCSLPTKWFSLRFSYIAAIPHKTQGPERRNPQSLPPRRRRRKIRAFKPKWGL